MCACLENKWLSPLRDTPIEMVSSARIWNWGLIYTINWNHTDSVTQLPILPLHLSPEPLLRDTPAAKALMSHRSQPWWHSSFWWAMVCTRKGNAWHQCGPPGCPWSASLGLCLFMACPTYIQHWGLAYKESSPLRIFLNQLWSTFCFLNEPFPCGIRGCVCSSSTGDDFFISALTQPPRTSSFLPVQFTTWFLLL